MNERCNCSCRRGSSIAAFTGAELTDVVEAAVACASCIDGHCSVLLVKSLANDPLPEPPEPAVFVAWEPSDAD